MEIYQHFREDEQQFIDQVLSWKEEVERTYTRKLTDFLDPREQQIVHMVIGTNHDVLQVKASGGGKYSERKRMIIAPFYEEIKEEDFQLVLLQAKYHQKFVSLEHRDIMGSFLSLGIKRKKLGDIYVENGLIQLLMAEEISIFVMANLTTIKRAKVKFQEVPLIELTEKKPNWQQSDSTVSSLRLDTVVKEIYKVSRNEASEWIKKRLVKVNFKIVEEAKLIVQENDMISVRGKGRSKVVAINGRTKKDKLKITTARLTD